MLKRPLDDCTTPEALVSASCWILAKVIVYIDKAKECLLHER